MSFTLSPERAKSIDEIVSRYPEKRAAVIPVLHVCQQQNGWVSPEVVDWVASRLDVDTSIVQGVVTFYTMYHQKKVAPNVVWVCRTLSCELRGGKVIQEHLQKRFGCHVGETSKDGKFTLLKAECLAACGYGPMVQINDEFFENLTIERIDRILDELAAKTPSPQNGEGEKS